MKLTTIKPETLLDCDCETDSVFVELPFLYAPVLQELKRKEPVMEKLYIKVNLELVSRVNILLSLLRLCSLPETICEKEETMQLFYREKYVEIEFSNCGMLFEGSCELKNSVLVFSENLPYIKVEKSDGGDSVIVLPEGDGYYYMNLDKKESEEERRTSIIGNPVILKEIYNWMQEKANGKIISL